MTRIACFRAIAAVFFAILFSRTLTIPIKTLTKGAEKLGKGELNHRVSVDTHDEFMHLANSFNMMAERLFESRERLRQSEADLKRAQEMAHLGSWDWNIVTGELKWTDEIYRIFGHKPQEFGATYEAFLKAVHPDDRESVVKAVDLAVKGEAPYDIGHRITRPDGSERVSAQGCTTRMRERAKSLTSSRRPQKAIRCQLPM